MNKYWIHKASGQKAKVYIEGDPVRLSWKHTTSTYIKVAKKYLEEFYIPITKAEYDSDITLKEIERSRDSVSIGKDTIFPQIKPMKEDIETDSQIPNLEVGGNHYQQPIQVWDFVYANHIPFDEASVIKYICRHKQKNGAEDIEKAISYCKHILKTQYGKEE